MELALDAWLTAIVGVAAFLIAALQLFLDQQSRARQRDGEMTNWGFRVVDVMAEIETRCHPLVEGFSVESSEFERLSERASALIDQGRLFFPNVGVRKGRLDDEGIRVKVLDEVLKACYVARHCAVFGTADGQVLRGQVWDARRRFVSLLQQAMGQSMVRGSVDSAGQHIAKDPTTWAPPSRVIGLPGVHGR